MQRQRILKLIHDMGVTTFSLTFPIKIAAVARKAFEQRMKYFLLQRSQPLVARDAPVSLRRDDTPLSAEATIRCICCATGPTSDHQEGRPPQIRSAPCCTR